uniref:SCAN domain-containing protein 1 n=1 Tax=Jaculus jaculus TaxID=51337 RepID=UPI00033316DB|nr:SCAN domain-containing protein 1 [Jaculus jaculus]
MSVTEPSLTNYSPSATPREQREEAGSSSEPASSSKSEASPPVPEPAGPGAATAAAPEARPPPPAALDSAPRAEAAPRPGDSRLGPETFRQRFRQFRYQDAAGPREAFRQLRELSRQWLRPDIRTKEQIVEMLVMEQLLTIMPEAARGRRGRRRTDVRITG